MSVTQLDSRDHLLLALLVGAPLAAVTTLNGQSPVCNARTAAAARALLANGRPPRGGGQLRRGSQLKNRRASASPATPHAATTSTSVQWKAVPRNAACIPSAKVPDREDPRDPQDPLRGVVAERDEYPVTRC